MPIERAFVSGGGETPLIESAKDLTGRSAKLLLDADGNVEVVRVLLAHHAAVSTANKMGSTSIVNAAIRSDARVVRMLRPMPQDPQR